MNPKLVRRLCWFAAIAFFLVQLAIALPLFLRSPLWVDVTLYDIAAWNVMQGGTHYRDTFDTNLPGQVWLHILIRGLLGWSSEAILCVDLVVVYTSAWILMRLLRQSGIGFSGQFAFLIVFTMYYLFESEYIRCQRDVWMLLPVLAAIYLRIVDTPKRERGDTSFLAHASGYDSGAKRLRLKALAIGILIGCAIWIKPHVVLPAGLTYLWIALREPKDSVRRPGFLWILGGTLLMGLAGGLWLVLSGTLMPMIEVFRDWNTEYYDWSWEEFKFRYYMFTRHFQPWCRFYALSFPLAFYSVARAIFSRNLAPYAFARSTLSVLFLSWSLQALLIQKGHPYISAPCITLSLAVLASYFGRWIALLAVWCVIGSLGNEVTNWERTGAALRELKKYHFKIYTGLFPPHNMFDSDRLALWPDCIKIEVPDATRDLLPYFRDCNAVPSITDEKAVLEFLRPLNLKSGEFVSWSDATHTMYRELNLKPGIRYLHVRTALQFRGKRDQIREELLQTAPRYAVADLSTLALYYEIKFKQLHQNELTIPSCVDRVARNMFPWDQKLVFRSGRYYVFEIIKPIGPIWSETFDEY